MRFWKHLLLVLVGIFFVPWKLEAKEYPRLVKGVLDVRGWDFEKDGSIPLRGEAEFYWDRWMDPDPAKWDGSIQPSFIDIKGGWQKSGYPVYGKGTYRVRIEGDRPVKLVMGEIRSATDLKVYVNGSILNSSERTPDGRLLFPFKKPQVLSEAPATSFDILFHAENQDYILGGIVTVEDLGLHDQIFKSFIAEAIVNAGVFFALLTLALYNIGLYTVNRTEWGPLLIAACCICVSGLIAIEPGLCPFLYGSDDKLLPIRVYNLSFYTLLPVLWLYLKVMFPDVCYAIVVKIVVLFGTTVVAITAVSSPRIYLGFSTIYHVASLLTLIYMIVQSARATRRKELGASILLLGAVVCTIFSILTIFMMQGYLPRFPAAAIGMLFFCFSQSFILSMRFAETLRQVQRSEVEIRTLNENLQEKERARTLFFHNTSHELRTPLNGIIGFLDLIEQGRYGNVTEATHQQLSKVKSLAISLKQQVNTILDLAKSKQGKLSLKNTQFPLQSLIQDSQNLAEGLALKKPQVQFHLETPGMNPNSLWIHDYDKVFTIIRNLIGNAFKFTAVDKPSQVTLTLRLGTDRTLEIVVSDTGIGIPASHKDKIFQEFQQVENDARRSYEGTGLGLAMVRDLVNLMGGTISFESEEGKGSTFSVKIPAQTVIHVEQSEISRDWAKACSPAPLPKSELGSVSDLVAQKQEARHLILVVDDNEMNCEVVRDILTLEGYDVILAFGGQDALLKLREHHPDLVLLDLMMPEVSGEDVLQAMRRDPDLDNIPVILLTARATEEDRIHGLELGADDYLAKPLIARELILRVHNLLLRIESTRLLEGVEHREKMALMGELLSDLSHELKNIHHADAYGSKSLLEYVEPLLNLFPDRADQDLSAQTLLVTSADITQAQAREQRMLATITGKPERQDRRLAMYLASLPVPDASLLRLWDWSRALRPDLRLAWESLLAMLQHVNTLSQSSERTQELITAVLDYGRYHKAQSTVDISRVIASSLTFLQARFRRAGIKVENQVQALEAQASSSDVQQIALNILNNAYDAVKDLSPDQERLVVITVEEDVPHQLIRLRFVNKGPGIPAEVLPRIFERRFTTKGDKGSGLGLYVSRRLAVKNHGDLQADSRDGETAFELTLRKAG
ncbi:ATP-binding protein [Oligoflexus tunisiensis]|uniref:ATP-binding protein n=1 Tax=Oligoflexus tunisiensis TaxID=708132 RepID=UPI00159EF902|nr:ATP-binding protein [Oligoflexus tunisiensis]